MARPGNTPVFMNKSFPDPTTLAGPVKKNSPLPLKTLVVVEPGGAGTFGHVEGLVHFLIEKNQQVFLAYSDKRSGPALPALVDFVNNHGGKCLNLKVANAPCLGDISAFLRLRHFANKIQPDVIHSHSSKAGILARGQALAGMKGRQFYTPHAYYGLADRAGLMNAVYNQIESHFGGIGQTFNVSEDEREFAINKLRLSPAKCLFVPNAVKTDRFLPSTGEGKKEARRRLNVPEDGVVLGWIGRLSYQKDPQTLFRAVSLAIRAEKKLHLLQVGQGEEQKSLNRLAGELGIQSSLTQIPMLLDPLDFYHAIDGLILTSRYEGCPISALESLSVDLPLIVSQAPGTKWLTRCGLSHCWSAPSNDANAFAVVIAEWMADLPENRKSNHRPFAIEHFVPAHIYGQILNAYRTEPVYLAS
jgi:glycosyltransferase involved in cell wall biosynthesis